MKFKVGVKLFTNNFFAIKVVERYYSQGLCDFVELMVLPGADSENLDIWKKLKIPYLIHVSHGKYGFNLSDPKLRKQNKKTFDISQKYADKLGAKFIIVHPGLTGKIEETIRQIKILKEPRLIVENMPFISLRQTRCVGYSPEEIKKIKQQTRGGVCLDIVHAVKAAYANGEDHLDYLKRFLSLYPKVIHVCDSTLTGCFDEHLNLGKGALNFSEIVKAVLKAVPKAYFTLEVPEKAYSRLTNYKMDRLLFKRYLERVSL